MHLRATEWRAGSGLGRELGELDSLAYTSGARMSNKSNKRHWRRLPHLSSIEVTFNFVLVVGKIHELSPKPIGLTVLRVILIHIIRARLLVTSPFPGF